MGEGPNFAANSGTNSFSTQVFKGATQVVILNNRLRDEPNPAFAKMPTASPKSAEKTVKRQSGFFSANITDGLKKNQQPNANTNSGKFKNTSFMEAQTIASEAKDQWLAFNPDPALNPNSDISDIS